MQKLKIKMQIAVLFFLFSGFLAASPISDLMKAGKWEQAKESALAEIARNPEDSSLYLTAGICEINLKNYGEAIKNLSKAYDLNPKSYLAGYLLGVIYEETGDLKEAVKYFEKSYKVTKDKEKRENIEKHIKMVGERMNATLPPQADEDARRPDKEKEMKKEKK